MEEAEEQKTGWIVAVVLSVTFLALAVAAIIIRKRQTEAELQLRIDLARRASAANVVSNGAWSIDVVDETGAPIVLMKESEAYSKDFSSVTYSRARVNASLVNPMYDEFSSALTFFTEKLADSDEEAGYFEVVPDETN